VAGGMVLGSWDLFPERGLSPAVFSNTVLVGTGVLPVGRAFSLDIEAMVALGVARRVASLGFTGTGYPSSTAPQLHTPGQDASPAGGGGDEGDGGLQASLHSLRW